MNYTKEIEFNKEEVKDVKWVDTKEMNSFIKDHHFTPWFLPTFEKVMQKRNSL